MAGRVVAGLKSIVILFALLLAGAAVSQVPALRAVDSFVSAHQAALMSAAVVVLALGFGLFFGGLIAMTIRKGRWMSGKELDEYYRGRSQPVLGVHQKMAGSAPVFAARDAFTLGDLKAAWRRGELGQPLARNRAIRALGAMLAFVGFCLLQFSLPTPVAKGYAVVLLATGAIWLAIRWARA